MNFKIENLNQIPISNPRKEESHGPIGLNFCFVLFCFVFFAADFSKGGSGTEIIVAMVTSELLVCVCVCLCACVFSIFFLQFQSKIKVAKNSVVFSSS